MAAWLRQGCTTTGWEARWLSLGEHRIRDGLIVCCVCQALTLGSPSVVVWDRTAFTTSTDAWK